MTKLHQRASASRDAEVSLGKIGTDLNALQSTPWMIEVRTPEGAARQMRAGERRIESGLADLKRDTPSGELDAIAGPLHTNFEYLERVRVAAATNRGADAVAAMSTAARGRQGAARALDVASAHYRAHAEDLLQQARIGSGLTILALLGAFVWFYRRSVDARGTAETLAHENAQLLEASQHEALTDALTGLPNRRALMSDVAQRLPNARPDRPLVLGLFDLDGFKEYNDTFGHPAGDALLERLGARLRSTLEGIAPAYRMGGDEFCVLASVGPDGGDAIARLAASALSDSGDAFEIGCSYGAALIPTEATSAEEALRAADQKMYEQKAAGRRSASRQSTDVLLKVLGERNRELEQHVADVAQLAEAIAEQPELPRSDVKKIRLAAELHDIGKTAIPDAILQKPAKLSEAEWAFMRRHTTIAERIIRAAPSLAHAARIVRSSAEHVDGTGYPHGLSKDQIPLGSRIIAVCDAYYTMLSDRPYREARSVPEVLAELRRCAGTQFDPEIVSICCRLIEGTTSVSIGQFNQGALQSDVAG